MREIICGDAIEWLKDRSDIGAVVTSLPDPEEMNMSFENWLAWFHIACQFCLKAASPGAPVIFYQTDRKHDGELASKAFLAMDAAYGVGSRLLWHKIVIRRGVGKIDIHRPGYSHLIAFSREGRSGKALPDVIERGNSIYPNAMGINAARLAVGFAAQFSKTIVDPFCGKGTVPALAEAMGLNAIGIDIDPEQCAFARGLKLIAGETSYRSPDSSRIGN